MTNLSYLYLSENNFVNSVLPRWLSNATTLEGLYIGLSNIQGPISNVEWGKLCTLQVLYLSHKKISGDKSQVVEGLSSCSNTTLEFLSLCDNQLTGQMPNSLGHLKKLRIFAICFNPVSSTIPTTIEHLSGLEILDLGERENQLKGALPEIAADNKCFGRQPFTKSLCKTPSTEKVISILWKKFCSQLDHNDWVPPFSLIEVELRSCSLGPNFPTWLETQKQLEVVILSSDSISDPIPPWLWNLCSQLQYLDLSDNQIGGNLPRLVSFKSYYSSWTVDFYSSYKYGVVVDLSSNRFNGLLPLWPDVTHMNLANNLFSGSIPITIGHVMTKLQVLDLSGNAFTGSIPYSITKVKKLLRLDISDNHLSGKLPDWWYELQQLHVIDLLGNNLSGGIPPSVCSPPSVFWLRLSRNNLSGELPKSLRNCNSLVTLDIGENKINGSIPQWFGERLLSLQKLRMTGL
ncbi:hypothetical protein RND71_000813 [Anisodus tanguticus]|uniref:Uncharacterized protein n=1 Tax=Anisodus tanguticus TaxID=243964 RepID=A0AAE1T1U8_9SOLA|nr:hypothetical protein RND71_000813 [Anisodus tanguticus]